MHILWLILGSFILPLIWGWIVHHLMARLWPEKPQQAGARKVAASSPSALADYQI